MLRGILDEKRKSLLRELHRQLGELRVLLVRVETSEEHQKALARAISQLDELFLLVVVGEFNAGKSAVINALARREGARGGAHPHHLAGRARQVRRRAQAHARRRRLRGDRAAARAPARDEHRRHPRHERRRRGSRGADARLRAALGARALRDLRRSAVHGERAAVPRDDPRLGQEGGGRGQQDRHPGGSGRRREGGRVRARQAARAARPAPRGVRSLGAPDVEGEDGRLPARRGAQRLRSARGLPLAHARRRGPPARQAREPAGRRRPRDRGRGERGESPAGDARRGRGRAQGGRGPDRAAPAGDGARSARAGVRGREAAARAARRAATRSSTARCACLARFRCSTASRPPRSSGKT